jgi:hypothetical protein
MQHHRLHHSIPPRWASLATIGVDERTGEHATMLAFGLPPRMALGMRMDIPAGLGVME